MLSCLRTQFADNERIQIDKDASMHSGALLRRFGNFVLRAKIVYNTHIVFLIFTCISFSVLGYGALF